MRQPFPPFESVALRFHVAAMAVAFPLFCLSSCDGGKEEETTDASSSSPVQEKHSTNTPPVEVPKPPEFPPLAEHALGRVADQCVLIRVDGHPDRPGILLSGNPSSSGQYEYQVIYDPPSAPKTILCAAISRGDVFVARAFHMAVMPGGLHVYGFTSDQPLTGHTSRTSLPTGPFYACRLEATGLLADEERELITEKLASTKERLKEVRDAHPASRRAGPPERRPSRHADGETLRRGMLESNREQRELMMEISVLEARLAMPVGGVTGSQVAAAATEDAFQEDDSALEGTVLVARDAGVLAIRHDERWIAIDELLESAAGEPSQVTMKLYGSRNDVRLSCAVDWTLSFGKTGCSIVAATTFELESMDGGSLEERLAMVKPEPMITSRSKSTANKTLQWNGEPTSLWIRIFKDDQPDKPIIDEVILLDHADHFQAKWGRPPSPLIAIPQPEPDTPTDLAGEASALDARGTVLDLIAAGDGSVLMVQTDEPPYWQALDLKSGRFIEASWKAGPDTLLATQAGKIHLIDRKTRIVETWDLDGKSRTGLQILQLDDEIVAAAAPLSSPGSPLLITTTTEGAFFDPVDFEILANGFDMSPCFSQEDRFNRSIPKLVPESIRVRASDDGALFMVSGIDASRHGRGVRAFRIIVDPSSTARMEATQGMHLASRGRRQSESFPDHGGTGIQLRTTAGSNSFPGPAGTITFVGNGNRETVGVLRGSPVVPPDPQKAKGPLARDRGLYFDSSVGVLVVPDGRMLHLMPVNLPEQPAPEPQFIFAGETIRIPLPKGSGHKLVSSIGGEVAIGETEISWSIPADAQRGQANLKLEWNGELGSAMNASFNYPITEQAPGLSVESVDGKTRLPLRRTGIINGAGNITGFAGSGHVMLTSSGNERHAWSLTDYRALFTPDERTRVFFGDADQLYTMNDQGVLKAFDIQTGELVNEASFGESNHGRQGISAITAGMSSRLPLLAVEREGHKSYLQHINRTTLESTLFEISSAFLNNFTSPQFQTNPSGSATWSPGAAVIRVDDKISLRSFSNVSVSGIPDESGRYVVSGDGILDIHAEPLAMIRFKDLPGGDRLSYMGFDVSGRYVLLRENNPGDPNPTASVRDVGSPGVELFKIRFPQLSGTARPQMISGAGKLICQMDTSNSSLGVFELDVPAVLRKLAEPSENR